MPSPTVLAELLHSLVIFRHLHTLPTMIRFRNLIESSHTDKTKDLDLYAEFCCELFANDENWSRWLLNAVLQDDNFYVRRFLRSEDGSTLDWERSLRQELSLLQQLSQITSEEMLKEIGAQLPLPTWQTEVIDFDAEYQKMIREIPQRGFGIFARHHVFVLDSCGELVPIQYPDAQKLTHLYSYERERSKIIQNTVSFLNGLPANNVLLYGDAGTGKSSTVKAIANEYRAKGLRLIEVKKNQLYLIPALLDSLAGNPLKFIIFIDDLCFQSNDSDFAALKAILEGSVTGRGQNVLIYATSNHRHMIKETFGDRQGDEIHLSDTLQEMISLSTRFGLTVTFSKPEKEQYCDIIQKLAEQYQIKADSSDLLIRAEAYAIRSGGRNPRIAKQFIEGVKAGIY